jgi:hypothetical protein
MKSEEIFSKQQHEMYPPMQEPYRHRDQHTLNIVIKTHTWPRVICDKPGEPLILFLFAREFYLPERHVITCSSSPSGNGVANNGVIPVICFAAGTPYYVERVLLK